MKRLVGFCVALVMVVGSPLSAQETKEGAPKAKAKAQAKKADTAKKPNAKNRKQATLAARTLRQLAALELTEEQKKQIQTIAAEYEPKLKEAQKKVNALIPEEQRKARQEALAKARAEGKKPADVVTAFKPTEEQAAAQKAVRDINQEFNKKVNEVLTREQKQARRKARQEANDKKPAGETKSAPKKSEAKAE